MVQGIGGASAMANNMGIITEAFPARERGRALGLLASFVALGMMCGPVLGFCIIPLVNAVVGHPVTAFVEGRPDIFLAGYHMVYVVTATLVAIGFCLTLYRSWEKRRR